MDTILIVDDEPDLLEGLRGILEQENFRVIDCRDGHEARLRVFEDPPDLIISDIRMPGMDGWSLVEELHQLPLTKDTPFLFLTGHAEPSTYADAIRSGVDGVLTKPIHAAELVAAVRKRLERTRSLEQRSHESHALFETTLSRALPHGLNTSLHIIGGYAALLASASDVDRENIAEYSGRIQEAVRRLQASLQKLWLLLSLEEQYSQDRGKGSPNDAAGSSLQPVVQDVVSTISAATKRPIHLTGTEADITLDLPTPLLQDLLRELVDNAARFSAAGTPVHISIQPGPTHATITIADQGRGLVSSPVEGLSAFERFQSDRFDRKGHGLGLTIVHRILRLAGGDIQVRGETGQGTTISVTLRRLKP